MGASRDVILSRLPMMGADIGKKAEETYVDVEFFPDRPDLYSAEGVARALRGFLGIEGGLSRYEVHRGKAVLEVDPSVNAVRPLIACAVVRGLEFSDPAIESLMDLQEDLHWGLGRNRRKVAIGVHDISRVEPPFKYLAENPERKFVPLDFTEEMTMRDMLTKHPKGVGYGHILEGFDRYPLIVDSKNRVLSFPPIINGDLTRVEADTHDLFIDVTGTDPVVHKALNIVVTALAERGGKIESVLVKRNEGDFISPNLTPARWTVSCTEANSLIGFDLQPQGLAAALERMRFGAKANGRGVDVEVEVPAYRADIMHSWDIFEDAAKGFGYENLTLELPKTVTVGKPHPIEARKAEIRDVMTGLGYLEVLPFTLTSEKVQFEQMRRPPAGETRVLHPISELHTILRTTILPSLLEIFALNQHHPLPQRIFAVGEVVENEKTKLNLACASIHSSANFSEIRSIADAVLQEMMIKADIELSGDGAFLPGRAADIVDSEKTIGVFGEVHPAVVSNFGLEQPVVGFEMRWGEL